MTISSDVLPEFREYERTLTACMNSYVRPQRRERMSESRGLAARARRQGRAQPPALRRRPDDAWRRLGEPDLRHPLGAVGRRRRRALHRAAGGLRERPHLRHGGDVDRRRALPSTASRRSSGRPRSPTAGASPGEVIPIKVPSVNVRSVGAGGGSIAHVPEVTGALRVGPQSAGADPGPACLRARVARSRP